jgi:Tfp pilus assembly protein PilF
MSTSTEVLLAAFESYRVGDLARAQQLCREILAADSRNADAWRLLGVVADDRRDFAAAIQCYRQAIACGPDVPDSHFNLGVVFQKQVQLDAAAEAYRGAIRAKPDYAQAHNNLGTVYKLQYKLNESIACYERALECRPNFAEALNNLGNVLKTQGRAAEATICYEQTLRIKPDHAQARYNRSLMHLAAGDLAAGWPDYECRAQCPGFVRRDFSEPLWQGDALAGRVLLVHAEQGLGDTIQFVRYVPFLAREGAKIVLEVPGSLLPLLKQSGYGRMAALVATGAALPHFDVQAPLLSLPGIFGTTLDDVPGRVPYLAADPQSVNRWAETLAGPERFKIGIAWQGSKAHSGDRYRSIPLACFAPLAQGGVEFISLQKGPGAEQLADVADQFQVREVGRFDEEHGAFMDSAAVMLNLDLVVTSDTAVAHLAGALGVRVWVALALAPDWRWMFDRPDSPWYPTMRLFRQLTFDDWPAVFDRMGETLRRELAQRP